MSGAADIDEDDYDSPWKAAIQRFTEPFMALLFPQIHAEIDWSYPVEFLDQELQRLTRDAEVERGVVDRLLKVRDRSGQETWVLVHIEVQAQRDPRLLLRMYGYPYRIFDRYRKQAVCLAVLTGEQLGSRPSAYRHELWGRDLSFSFPVVKLSDFVPRWEELEASENPFAAVVMAHLKTQATRGAPAERARWKRVLSRWLFRRGWNRDDILELYRFVDWLMALPEALQRQHEVTLEQEQGEQVMAHLTVWERRGLEKGLKEGVEKGLKEGVEKGLKEGVEKGLKEGVLQALEVRFGALPDPLVAAVREVSSPERLSELLRQAIVVESLERFAAVLQARR